ncbi:MAG: hypothetical protein IKE69_11680 [Thermoguttaceae bacterium]|nr:hypothetical protein [Thermoguttaceae bacterium]
MTIQLKNKERKLKDGSKLTIGYNTSVDDNWYLWWTISDNKTEYGMYKNEWYLQHIFRKDKSKDKSEAELFEQLKKEVSFWRAVGYEMGNGKTCYAPKDAEKIINNEIVKFVWKAHKRRIGGLK